MTDLQSPEETTGTPTEKGNGTEIRQKALQEELRQLLDVVGPGPLVDLLLERAFQLKATDVHLDPSDSGIRVRLRVDGLLHDVLELPAELTSQVVSRVKLMAGMDITERRVAQDGHIANAVLQHQRDVRVGSGPTIHGERLVMRLMPDSTDFSKFDELGLNDWQREKVLAQLRKPYGVLLAVGPVGCGKTTTLYACLNVLNDVNKSVVTIEDPVERRIEGVNQIQIDSKINFGFVDALRGVLRQDPNVVMVGEIRDPETAHIACRAGLTGVSVLSTLHANDTAATIDVFREFSVPPMFIGDSLNCIISQRLLRKNCPVSREFFTPDEAQCQLLGIDPAHAHENQLVRGIPADENFHTGYSGRMGAFEIMPVDDEMRQAILHGKSHQELMDLARHKGMETLEEAGKRLVREGQTSVEELHRVLTVY